MTRLAHAYCDGRMWHPEVGEADSDQIAEALYWLWKRRKGGE